MKNRLDEIITNAKNPNYRRLAEELQDFVVSDALEATTEKPNMFDKIITHWEWLETNYMTETRVKYAIVITLLLLGVPSFLQLVEFSMASQNPVQRDAYLLAIADEIPHITSNGAMWACVLIMSDGALGCLLTIGGLLIVAGRRTWGTETASISLVIKLVAINLLLFYTEQFSTVFTALIQFTVLQALYFYQRKYIKKPIAR